MDVFGRGGAPEFVPPIEERGVEAWFDVKRRGRIPHPFQSECHHAWCCEWDEMTGYDHARVAVRSAIALRGFALDDGDLEAASGAIIRCGQANHACTNDDDAFAHVMRLQPGPGPENFRAATIRASLAPQ